MNLYTLTSNLHNEIEADASQEQFITDIELELGAKFNYRGSDYSLYGKTGETDIIYVRTGGTEGMFKSLGLEGDIILLTSGKSNSLAASMEIIAWLRRNSRKGRIIHGTVSEIAAALRAIADGNCKTESASGSGVIRPLKDMDLGGIRLGVIGRPSDWLIASDVDYDKVKRKLNAELVDIPMSELIDSLASFDGDMRSIDGSLAIYEALKVIIARYRLGGLTLRCFDLLDTVHNTGCLALSRLNAEGIPSSCEGDIPALLSMVIMQKEKGVAGFQCNLSRIEGDRLLFAHCAVPLNMVRSFSYRTHFESGIGTAIKGEFEPRDVTIFRVSPDLETCVSIPGRIVENRSEASLCRTQIIVEAPLAPEYMLNCPLANHHVIG